MFGWFSDASPCASRRKPCETLRVFRESFRKDFDSHVAAELGVTCPVDFAHAAFTDGLGDLVGAEFRTVG